MSHVATAIGVQAIEHHRRKVHFFSTVEPVNVLEQEKANGKAGQLADALTHSAIGYDVPIAIQNRDGKTSPPS